ncbi:MAG: hypothetical protein M1832_003847 [Thelocarpon impressellum]|nr:MAG: hypothetical protein M1832_003847 [Thelocarpon impressellum]
MAPSPGASLLLDSPSTDRGTKASTPQRAIFEDLPTAHSSITNAQRQKGVLDGRPGSSAAAATAPVGAPAPKQFAAALDYPDQLPSPSVPNADSSMVMTPESESTPAAVVSAKPVPSSGWMGKLSNVFQRRGDSPDTPESADRVSFKNSRSSQSNPHLGRVAPNYLDHHPRLSVSAKQISSHHHQTSSSSQYSQPGAASASVHTGLARMHAMSVDDASEYSVDPLAQAPSPDENHGFEDVNLGSEDETAEMDLVTGNFGAISKGSEFGSFDFGIVKKADNTDCKRMSNLNNAEQPPTWKKDKGIAFGPRGQPPTVPLPPGPPSSFVRADFRESRDNSTTFGTLSQSSSYGDTRNLLELSQQILALREAEAAKVKASASPSRRSGNLRLGNKDPNATMGTSIDFLPAVAYTRPEARRDGSGQSSNELSTFRMTRTLPQNPASSLASRKGSEVSGGGSVKDAKALDRDISLEMKRIDEMGRSTSNSIVVFNENGLSHEDSRASLADLGPGGLQSQSSRELSSHRSSISDDSGHGASDKGSFSEQAGVARSRPRISAVQGRAEVTSKGSFAASLPSTNSSGSEQDDNVPNRFHIDEEDGDWETIGGSGVLSRSGTALGFRHPTTGSSLADYSDRASSPEHGPSPKSYATSLPRHPADERYEHVYRVHETTPDGNPMLLPAYNFKFNGGAGFPSRNALTPPAPANLSASNPYRHPMPLGEDHVHPFKSSPPVVMSSARTLPRAYLRDDSPDEQSPNMLDSSEAAAYDRQVLFPRSYGAAAPTYSVHDSPPAAEHAARGRREQFGDYLDMDSSIPSSAWMDAFCESSEDIEPDVPGANGSFAKVTTLGPNANITGTPDGTGMRQVGSSLADRSSPGMNWSSSPQGHKTSPVERVLGLRQQRYELPSSPPAAHLSSSSGHAKAQPGVLYEQIRAHREQLAAEGLLPRAFTPPTPRPISGPLRPNSLMDPRASALDVTGSSGWNTSAFQAPFYLNPTPPLPPPTDAEKAIGFDYRLHRHPRENSSADTAIWKRKQNLSRAILALCFFFPPMLLLLGYGMLDALMSSLTSGSITHVGNVEKKIALWVGWALAAGAVIGIVAGMIVVGLGN